MRNVHGEGSARRVLWIEQKHPGLEYYDALRLALVKRGLNVTDAAPSSRHPGRFGEAVDHFSPDAALVGFGGVWGPFLSTFSPPEGAAAP